MRTRKFLAALSVGVLAALALATPARADAIKPAVSWDDSCGTGKVAVTVATTGDEKITFKVTAKAKAKEDPKVVVDATEINASSSQKTWAVTSSTELTVSWKPPTGGESFEAVSMHTWALPDKCKPTFEVINPSCENQALRVVVKNPALPGVTTVKAGSKQTEMNTKIAKGAQVTFSAFADFSIYVNGGLIGSNTIHQYFKYVAPSACTGTQPTPTTTDVVVNPGGDSGDGSGGGSSLPVTGTNTDALVAVGVVLLLLGAITTVAIRRRRSVRFTA